MSEYKQQVIDFFDKRTAYDAEGDSHPNEAKKLLAFAPIKAGQTILDLATGTGLVAMPSVMLRKSLLRRKSHPWGRASNGKVMVRSQLIIC